MAVVAPVPICLADSILKADAMAADMLALAVSHVSPPGTLTICQCWWSTAGCARCCRAAWRSVLQALAVAAGDSSAAVVHQALDALQPVIHALYRRRARALKICTS